MRAASDPQCAADSVPTRGPHHTLKHKAVLTLAGLLMMPAKQMPCRRERMHYIRSAQPHQPAQTMWQPQLQGRRGHGTPCSRALYPSCMLQACLEGGQATILGLLHNEGVADADIQPEVQQMLALDDVKVAGHHICSEQTARASAQSGRRLTQLVRTPDAWGADRKRKCQMHPAACKHQTGPSQVSRCWQRGQGADPARAP